MAWSGGGSESIEFAQPRLKVEQCKAATFIVDTAGMASVLHDAGRSDSDLHCSPKAKCKAGHAFSSGAPRLFDLSVQSSAALVSMKGKPVWGFQLMSNMVLRKPDMTGSLRRKRSMKVMMPP